MSNPNSSAQRSFAAEPYDSVAAVLASKQITADLAGQLIHTKDGCAYRVAAANATDHHVTTAGGAKLYVLVVSSGFDAESFTGGSSGDVTAELQKAIDALEGMGGGVLRAPGHYKVSSKLVLKSRVIIDLRGSGIIEQTEDDIPIIDCTGGGLSVTSRWQVINGRLWYTNLQTSAAGSAILISKPGTTTSNWRLANLAVNRAFQSFRVDPGGHTFLGEMENVTGVDNADWVTFFGGGASVHTNIRVDGLWALQSVGSEQPGSKGHSFANVQELDATRLAGDGLRGGSAVSFTTCTGRVGTISVERCSRSYASGIGAWVVASQSYLPIAKILATGNSVTLSGSAEFGVLLTNGGSRVPCDVIIDDNTALTDTSSGSYRTVYTQAENDRVWNKSAIARGTSPAVSINQTSANQPKRVREFNGVSLTLDLDGMIVSAKATIPSTLDYPEGSFIFNSAQTVGGPIGWVRVGSLWQAVAEVTRATTAALDSVSNGVNTQGKFQGRQVFNTTTGNPVWAAGPLAADPWVDATGTTAHTPV